MSTRSHIGMVLKDGQVREIYCHFDGYPSHNGEILLKHYMDVDKITKLLDIGDISCLREEIGEKHDFDNAPKNQVNAYGRDRGGRDRGEKNVDARVHDSIDDFLNKSDEDYTYLFKDGAWQYRSWHKKLKPLTADDCKEPKV